MKSLPSLRPVACIGLGGGEGMGTRIGIQNEKRLLFIKVFPTESFSQAQTTWLLYMHMFIYFET